MAKNKTPLKTSVEEQIGEILADLLVARAERECADEEMARVLERLELNGKGKQT